jgi:ligand-binding SRPBCC domain-containing protein
MERRHEVDAWLRLPLACSAVFPFFAAAENLERITPRDLRFGIAGQAPRISEGCLIDYRLRLDGIPFRWRSRIRSWQPGRSFVDEQVAGPFRRWIHLHEFSDDTSGGTLIRDHVDLALPLQPVGELAWPYVRRKLRRIFRFRQTAVAHALGCALGEGSWAVEVR